MPVPSTNFYLKSLLVKIGKCSLMFWGLFLLGLSARGQSLKGRVVVAPIQPSIGAYGINQMIFDRFGYLWLATNNGLICMDGKQEIIYQKQSTQPQSIPSNLVFQLDTLPNQDFLLLTNTQVVHFDRSEVKFNPKSSAKINGELPLVSYCPAPFGGSVRLFSSQEGWHLLRVSGDSLVRRLLIPALPNETGFSGGQGPDGDFFVFSRDRGFRVSPKGEEVSLESIALPSQFPSGNDQLSKIYFHPVARQWVVTTDFGKVRLYDEDWNYQVISTGFDSYDFGKVNSVCVDRGDEMWLSTISGIYRTRFPVTFPLEIVAGNTDSYSGIQDRQGGMWFGTSRGLMTLPPLANQLHVIPLEFPEQNIDPVVWGISCDEQGDLWTGSQGGIIRIPAVGFPETGKAEFFAKPGPNTNLSDVQSMDGKIWVGAPAGMYTFDPESQRFSQLDLRIDNGKKRFRNFSLSPIGDSLLALVNQTSILALRPTDQKVLEDFFPNSNQVNWAVFQDSQGYWWMAGDRLQAYPNLPSLEPVLDSLWEVAGGNESFTVLSIFARRQEELYVNTTHGVMFFDLVKKELHLLHEKPGWPNTRCMGILGEEQGPIWYSSENGLIRYNPVTDDFDSVKKSDGSPSNDFAQFSYFRHPKGYYLFGTVGGIAWFHPDSVRPEQSVAEVVIEDIRINQKSMFGDSKSEIPQDFTLPELVLSPHEKDLTIHYSAPELRKPDAVRYRVKMEGLERDWQVRSSAERIAYYPTLRAGTYTFHVQARFGHGAWGKEKKIRIYLPPPFYERLWFRVLMVLAILGLLGLGVFVFVRRKLRQQTRIIEEQLRLQAERERISRDLHDHVGANLTALSMGLQTLQRQAPETADLQARLIVIESLTRQSIQKLRESVWALDSAAVSLGNFRRKIHQYLSEITPASGQDLEWEVICSHPELMLEANLALQLYRMLQEGIQNTFKHAEASFIEIGLELLDNNELQVELKDDGKGMNLGPSQDNGSKGHYGLRNLNARTEVLGGTLIIRSKAGGGTELKWLFPNLGQLP